MRPNLIILTFAMACLTLPTYAQDCTGPDGLSGDLLYNNAFNVFQGCTKRGWMAFHEESAPPDPCATSSTPGTACSDGQTVYAGSWNGYRYYTTTADQSTGLNARWGVYNVTLGANAQSTTDGLLNTNTALASIEANPQVGACNTPPYNPPACVNAHVLCKDLRTSLGGDWYLPAVNELKKVLYTNRVAIGGFTGDLYWSSTESSNVNATAVLFSGNVNLPGAKNGGYRSRCVRRE